MCRDAQSRMIANTLSLLSSSFLFASCAGGTSETVVVARIESTLNEAERIFESQKDSRSAQSYLNESRVILNCIQPYFYGVPGALHEHSEARQVRVERVEEVLGDYQPLLLELIETLKDPMVDTHVVTDLVKFTRPTLQIKSALLEVARSDTARPENAAAAYDAIFYLQLDDQEIRNEVVQKVKWLDERHSRSRLAAKIRNSSATVWAIPEMLDFWKSSLSTPFRPENYPKRGGEEKLANRYLWAAEALARFGAIDSALSEAARERASELKKVGTHSREVDKLLMAAEVLEGSRPPEIAVNWKGQLLGVSSAAIQNWSNNRIESND